MSRWPSARPTHTHTLQRRSELSTTQLKIALTDSAALRSCLLLNGRGSPELAGPLLLAYLRECGLSILGSSEYFLVRRGAHPTRERTSPFAHQWHNIARL